MVCPNCGADNSTEQKCLRSRSIVDSTELLTVENKTLKL